MDRPDRYYQCVLTAGQYLDKNDWSRAFELFKEAFSLDDDPKLRRKLAQLYFEKSLDAFRADKMPSALEWIDRSLMFESAHPNNKLAGLIHLQLGHARRSARHFKRARHHRPDPAINALFSTGVVGFVRYFDDHLYHRLDIRKDTFRRVFEYLEGLSQDYYTIVETGTTRSTGDWRFSGQSTRLFDMFVNFYDGVVYSVDIDLQNCTTARESVSEKTHVICSDSVAFLNRVSGKPIDLLYLDAYDAHWGQTHACALHHLKELAAVKTIPGQCLVVVDDNLPKGVADPNVLRNQLNNCDGLEQLYKNRPVHGKGEYIDELMRQVGRERFIHGYQLGWRVFSTKVVISLTTLPSRIAYIQPVLESLKSQTRPPEKIYLNLPVISSREECRYDIPEWLIKDKAIHIVHPLVDWGPATKLLPTLERECGETLIITVDDDIIYHDTLVEDLLDNHLKYPNNAIGFVGYNLQGAPFRHPNFSFRVSSGIEEDQPVDLLGGVLGILYKREFFAETIKDFKKYPEEAWCVDDDWIAGHLDQMGVGRMVISSKNTRKAHCQPTGRLQLANALNGPAHAPENIRSQEILLTQFVNEGCFLWNHKAIDIKLDNRK